MTIVTSTWPCYTIRRFMQVKKSGTKPALRFAEGRVNASLVRLVAPSSHDHVTSHVSSPRACNLGDFQRELPGIHRTSFRLLKLPNTRGKGRWCPRTAR
jgi:hypothetical protein